MSNGINRREHEVYYTPEDDEEYCCNCGTGLSRHERYLCYDCYQDVCCVQDEEFWDSWLNQEDIEYENE